MGTKIILTWRNPSIRYVKEKLYTFFSTRIGGSRKNNKCTVILIIQSPGATWMYTKNGPISVSKTVDICRLQWDYDFSSNTYNENLFS